MINMASSWSFLILLAAAMVAAADDWELQTKCSDSITKMYSCVNYAAGKDDSPSSDCCSEVSEIRNDNPVCLCYLDQLTHQGSPTIKSLGLQFDRLIQLPGACKLANSSASDCPELLNLSPSSPDSKIFAENVTAAGLQTKCSDAITKMYSCVNYAAGKDDSPSSDCCSEVSEIRNDNPVCLCYLDQLTHQGSPTIKSLGLQFDRLDQLPGACKLANSSASDCPELLNLSPSSPDSKIFTENVTAAVPASMDKHTPPPFLAPSSPTTMPGARSDADSTTHYIHMDYAFTIAMLSAIFLNIFHKA